MALRYPPEFGFRNAARLWKSTTTNQTTAGKNGVYRSAVCSEIKRPLDMVEQNRVALERNQVRLAIKRAAINFSDILMLEGKYQHKPALPFIPGSEITGHVLEVGASVVSVKPGDDVIALLFGGGGFAEEVITQDTVVHRFKSGLSYDEGASFLISYGTAEMSLVRSARIKQSDVVLVTAAAGALGLAAVDLAANVFQAQVIAACGGSEKCQLASSYGAKHTIDYNKENVRERVKELTKGRGVDIVFDVVGGQVLEDGFKCLAFEGRLLTLGFTSGQIPKFAANLILVKNISVHGVYWGSYAQNKPDVFQQSIKTVVDLWEKGRIKPHVGKVFPLSKANEALEYVAKRHSTGKILLDCTKTAVI